MSVRECLGLTGAFVGGVAIGAAIGVLCAPSSGEETRRRIGRRYGDEKERLRRRGQLAVERTAQRVERGIEDGKRRMTVALGG